MTFPSAASPRLCSCAVQVLWDSQPCVCGQVPDHGEVVLQWEGSHGHSLLHHHAPGESHASTAGTAAAASLQALVLAMAAAVWSIVMACPAFSKCSLQAAKYECYQIHMPCLPIWPASGTTD